MRALLCYLAACAPPHAPLSAPTPTPSAFGCTGAPETVDAPPPPVPPGRLEVSRTATGLKILAEDIPASQLAVRIGEVLNVDTRIDEGLDHVVLSLYAPDISIDTLADRLSPRAIEISRTEWHDHHILLVQNSDRWGGTARHPDLAPVQTRIMELRVGLTAEQTAALYCRTYATSVGAAQVIGNRVLVMDRGPVLDRFEQLLTALQR